MKSPFPYFGGKSRVASLVWERFGDVPNYCEPFFGSSAVLLLRPTEPRVETVNDIDCYLANFWRSLAMDPDEVAHWADWPVNEADLHARHLWLVNQPDFRERMKTDPDYYDAKIASWWVWGISQWIGSGWCVHPEWQGRTNAGRVDRGVHRTRPNLHWNNGVHSKRPNLTSSKGIHNVVYRPAPHLGHSGSGVHRKLIYLDRGGRGIMRKLPNLGGSSYKGVQHKRPRMGVHNNAGVHRMALHRPSQQIPDLSGEAGATGRGIHRSRLHQQSDALQDYFEELSGRLRRVRVACGDWSRITSPSVTWKIGLTGVFLDPPYSDLAGRAKDLYAQDCLQVAHDVREWAIANGDNPLLRIALCGYEGEHQMPENWSCLAWKSSGGYGSQSAKGKGRENSERERIWFSPHCLVPDRELSLFDEGRD